MVDIVMLEGRRLGRGHANLRVHGVRTGEQHPIITEAAEEPFATPCMQRRMRASAIKRLHAPTTSADRMDHICGGLIR